MTLAPSSAWTREGSNRNYTQLYQPPNGALAHFKALLPFLDFKIETMAQDGTLESIGGIDNILWLLSYLFSFLVTVGVSWIFYPALLVAWSDQTEWSETKLSSSKDNTESKNEETQPVLLSLVIPAYNEQDRIPIMLQTAHDFLNSTAGSVVLKRLLECSQQANYYEDFSDYSKASGSVPRSTIVEWIVVNDGSKDETCRVVKEFLEQHDKQRVQDSKCCHHSWRLISLNPNCGKGAAVKTGMLNARGHFRLMVDADGATDFGPGLERVVEQLCLRLKVSENDNDDDDKSHGDTSNNKMVAIFGSRAHLQNEAGSQRSLLRTILMHAFHFFVSLLVSNQIQDTQCGFKLFTQDAALAAFGNLHLRRWAFDTELVILSTPGNGLLSMDLVEVGVPWQEIDGSKLNTSKFALAWVSLCMLRDMICVRACYSLQIWKVNNHNGKTEGK
jgi:dolichyl-phosphate beta-glucosyltransferase